MSYPLWLQAEGGGVVFNDRSGLLGSDGSFTEITNLVVATEELLLIAISWDG